VARHGGGLEETDITSSRLRGPPRLRPSRIPWTARSQHAPAVVKIETVSALLGEATVSRAWRHQGSRPVVIDGLLDEALNAAARR
jgi:hypothetical protein